MKFKFSSFFKRGKKKVDSEKSLQVVNSSEKEIKIEISNKCKHYRLATASIQAINFEASLGELNILPNEVLELIMSLLPPNELAKAALISKGFWVMCSDDGLWRGYYKSFTWYSQRTRSDSDLLGSNSNYPVTQVSYGKDSCCWKEYFKRRYTSTSEIKARFQTQQQRITHQINQLTKLKQQETAKIEQKFKRSQHDIEALVVSCSLAVYMITIYNLWPVCKIAWDVLAFLPYVTIQYWFSYCYDFEHGLVLQCWNSDGKYYRHANAMIEALSESVFEDEYCISLVFPCFIVRAVNTMVWVMCNLSYAIGIIAALIWSAFVVKYFVGMAVTSKPFTSYFPALDLEELKRRRDEEQEKVTKKYSEIGKLQNQLYSINHKLESLRYPPSSSSGSTGSGYSCIVM